MKGWFKERRRDGGQGKNIFIMAIHFNQPGLLGFTHSGQPVLKRL